jgi:hypothetical protein
MPGASDPIPKIDYEHEHEHEHELSAGWTKQRFRP